MVHLTFKAINSSLSHNLQTRTNEEIQILKCPAFYRLNFLLPLNGTPFFIWQHFHCRYIRIETNISIYSGTTKNHFTWINGQQFLLSPIHSSFITALTGALKPAQKQTHLGCDKEKGTEDEGSKVAWNFQSWRGVNITTLPVLGIKFKITPVRKIKL